MLSERASVSVMLGLISMLIMLVAGILLGVTAAVRSGSRLDRAAVMFGVLGILSPAFVTGVLLLYVFSVALGWFPTFGTGTGLLDRLWHLALPSTALVLSGWRSS
jgi:peptide/nickel transport system permease protein